MLWDSHGAQIGHDVLLGALKRYLAKDADLPKSGGPGLQVWLRARRYEHWLADEPVAAAVPVDGFAEPYRSALVAACGDDWVRSYLDPCKLEGATLVVRTDFAIKKLLERRDIFRRLGLTGMRKRKLDEIGK